MRQWWAACLLKTTRVSDAQPRPAGLPTHLRPGCMFSTVDTSGPRLIGDDRCRCVCVGARVDLSWTTGPKRFLTIGKDLYYCARYGCILPFLI